ncbi:early nodulin-like protein 15 isoform X2 [Carex rostrata]
MEISKATFLLVFYLFVACSHAYTFYVGGREGWVLHPSESYSDWAGRNRFQVNDTIVFKYKSGEDSVLEVSQQDFDQCNLSNPIQKMDTGDSVFKFDRSGPFFFVSGTGDRCKQGQKLVVVVLAVRPIVPAPPMAPTLSPGPNSPVVGPPGISPASPPMVSPVAPPPGSLAPSPLVSPPTNSPVSPPTVTPAPSPFTVTPSVNPPTGSPVSNPSTQPSASGAPATSAPNADTPKNPTGSGAPVFRFSSVSFAVMVVILNYGFLN